MKHKNLYELTHNVTKGGFRRFRIHIEAYNMEEAKTIAKTLWYEDPDRGHMFRLEARRIPLDEVVDMAHWFVRIR